MTSMLPLLLSLACPQESALPSPSADLEPQWLWITAEGQSDQRAEFRHEWSIQGDLAEADLWTSCDNRIELLLDGELIARNDQWNLAIRQDLSKRLKREGTHEFLARCVNDGGPAGFWFELNLTYADGKQERLLSDSSWQVRAPEGAWQTPVALGELGVAPWGSPAGSVDGLPPRALPGEEIEVPPGFQVELLHTVPRESQGSWVSLTSGPGKSLFASDQYGGIFAIEPDEEGGVRVRELPLEIGQAQGLLWAFDCLYFVGGTGGAGSGLYRASDSTGDGELDEVELLQALKGGGEHGPHALRLTPDGQALYVIAGNHTKLPPLSGSRVPTHWAEDQLLPRSPDPRGHAVGIEAPGGWLCRVDRNGKQWELIACGMRNAYDFALDAEGEVFTFDSDMEWDVGLSWYRPTRVLHLVSGSDFGWRHGSGKWPASYPDSWPAVVDIGLASPTGVEFAPQSFPKAWRERLLIADWTHGVLYGVRLQPDGASFSGDYEVLMKGKPLPLTDLCVGADGAVYFTTGGRRLQSGLYRLSWIGEETSIAEAEPSFREMETEALAELSRRRRRQMEGLHESMGAAGAEVVQEVWGALSSEDPFLRRAARVVLEHQPVEAWRNQALSALDMESSLQALIALARSDEGGERRKPLQVYGRLPLENFDRRQLIDALRLFALIEVRMGPLAEREGLALRPRFEALFQRWRAQEDSELSGELLRVLVHLQSPSVLPPALDWLEASVSQEETVHLLFTLKDLRAGWTPELCVRYLRAFQVAMAKFEGGASLQQYLNNARQSFFESLDAEQQASFKPLLEEASKASEAVQVIPASFVRAWTVEDFEASLDQDWKGRDLERGRRLYERATCSTCHRFDRAGGNTGPDLTASGSRFSPRDLLETLLDPNLEVSDQYRDTELVTVEEELLVGRIEEEHEDYLVLLTLPPEEESIEIDLADIVLRRAHPNSRMPAGLLDSMKREEVLDLLAFLITGVDGDL